MRASGSLSAWALVVLLSGCIGPGGGDDLPGADPAPTFAPPLRLPHDGYAGEPSIAVLPDGTLFIAGQAGPTTRPGAVESTAWLWRSRDGGDTWQVLRSPDLEAAGGPLLPRMGSPPCSCDTDVVTSPDGWVYVTDWWSADGASHFLVERSPDGGDTWDSVPLAAARNPAAVVDRQWLLAGDDGFVALFWGEWDLAEHLAEGTGARVKAVYSHDHGATWTLPATVVGDTGALAHLQGHPLMLADGTIVLPMADLMADPDMPCNLLVSCPRVMDHPTVVRVALSGDGGATWSLVDVADLPEGAGAGLPLGAAADASGRVLVAYNANEGDGIVLRTVESIDGGRTWDAPQPLASGGLHVLPWVTATPEGRFAVAWYATPWSGPSEEAPEDTPWTLTTAQRGRPGDAWVVVQADDEPVATGPYCFNGADCTTRRPPFADFLSLVYAPDGALHVAYARSEQYTPAFMGASPTGPRTVAHAHHVRSTD